MTPKREKIRLDLLLVERGIAGGVDKALSMILAGEVRVDKQCMAKTGTMVSRDARIEVTSRAQKYASRGGIKLEGALQDFQIDVDGLVCLDVGASTGGFTDCLLQHGAARVYAVDVNVDQMAWKLQQDPRVLRIKRNARGLKQEDVTEQIQLVVVDVSFISVAKVLRPAAAVASAGVPFLLLVKPQFELPRDEVGPGGIVRDASLQQKAVHIVQQAAEAAGLSCLNVSPSRIAGAEGNQEYFLYAIKKPLE